MQMPMQGWILKMWGKVNEMLFNYNLCNLHSVLLFSTVVRNFICPTALQTMFTLRYPWMEGLSLKKKTHLKLFISKLIHKKNNNCKEKTYENFIISLRHKNKTNLLLKFLHYNWKSYILCGKLEFNLK